MRLQILRCTALVDEDPFGSNDAFVVVRRPPVEDGGEPGEELYRTTVKEESETPVWASAIVDVPADAADGGKLLLNVHDKDTVSDDFLGSIVVSVPAEPSDDEVKLELTRESEASGKIVIKWLASEDASADRSAPETDEKPEEAEKPAEDQKPEEKPVSEEKPAEESKPAEKEEHPTNESTATNDEPKPEKQEPTPAPTSSTQDKQKKPAKTKPTETRKTQKRASSVALTDSEHARELRANGGARTVTPTLTPEERDKVFQRLTNIPDHVKSPQPLPPLVQSRVMGKDEEATSVQRLYEDSVRRKKRNLEALDRRLYGDSEGEKKLVDPETCDQIIQKMYKQHVDKEEGLERTRNKYLRKYAINVKRFKDKEEEATVLDRLHNTAERERKRYDELFEKFNPKKSVLKRSKEDLSDNDKRYYEGGFARRR